MKVSERSNAPSQLVGSVPAKERLPVAKVVASTFARFDLAQRARLLARLLGSVGPLALKVVSGGVFAKYVRHARSREIPVSLEDAARASSSQVRELIRYIEQSDPRQVEKLLAAVSEEEVIAAPAIRRYPDKAPFEV
jgi:hypothetical protein